MALLLSQLGGAGNTNVTPVVATLTLTGILVATFVEVSLVPSVGALVTDGSQPDLLEERFSTPEQGTLLFTGLAPFLEVAGSTSLMPDVGLLVLAGLVPTVESSETPTPSDDELFALQRRRRHGQARTPLVRQWPPTRVR